ncbi:hypothetical protein SDJN03_19717, partial [Cucurbita argyrosperma subsp. sororia]
MFLVRSSDSKFFCSSLLKQTVRFTNAVADHEKIKTEVLYQPALRNNSSTAALTLCLLELLEIIEIF